MLTVEPDLTSRDTPPSTATPSKLLQMSSACRTGAPSDTAKALLLRGSVDRRDQPFDQQGNHPVQGDGDDEGFERHEVHGLYGARRIGEFLHRYDHQKGGVFQHIDELVADDRRGVEQRSEEHTSELQSIMRNS